MEGMLIEPLIFHRNNGTDLFQLNFTSNDVLLEQFSDDDADVGRVDLVDVAVDRLLQGFPRKTLKMDVFQLFRFFRQGSWHMLSTVWQINAWCDHYLQ
jgi:hypothetical protein